MGWKHFWYVFFACVFFSSILKSEEKEYPSLLSIGAGFFNVVRPNRVAQFQLEYKWGVAFHHIQPFVSAFITKDRSFYFCFGACGDIFFGKKIVLTPSFAPGIYIKGKGKDLHFPLEFRSSLALSYQFCNQDRLGVQFYHISNASLGHKNPGAESLILFYGISH